MIKLFDFKFLILLGLTLVVYFMYKEIDMQRERIQTIEESLKELLYKNIEDITSDDDELSLPPVPEIIPIPEKMGIKIELPNKILYNKDNKNNKNNKNNEQDTVLKTQSEESLKKDDKLDTDNKHLEIYSNDNENAQETSISDSLIKQKTNVNVNIDLDSSSEIISTESEESSSSMNESSNSEKVEKLDLKIEKLESSSEKIEKLESSSEKKDELNEVLKELKFEDINEQKLDLTNLLKLKVPEIQEMAKKENISLDKKINGVNKKKTKQELAEELVNKKN